MIMKKSARYRNLHSHSISLKNLNRSFETKAHLNAHLSLPPPIQTCFNFCSVIHLLRLGSEKTKPPEFIISFPKLCVVMSF